MSDLDKYLENIGINMDEEEAKGRPDEPESEVLVSSATPLRLEGSPQERAESFLVNLLLNFDPTYAVEIVRSDDSEIVADVYGGDPGKIIGRDGRTLQALEYLTNTVLNRGEGENVRVTIDVGGYKRRRDDRLRQVAQKAAARVRDTGQPFVFKPMSAAERRVVHMEFADDPELMSESMGEGKARRVVIKLRSDAEGEAAFDDDTMAEDLEDEASE